MRVCKFSRAAKPCCWPLFALAAVLMLVGCKPGSNTEGMELPVPEWTANRPTLDVESLKDNIDLNMDINQLTLSELRVLRNAFAARQGYCFNSADLRSIFEQTTWYGPLMMARWSHEEDGMDEWWDPDDKKGAALFEIAKKPITYTDEETAFIDRIKAREKELTERNFKMDEGFIVNVDNVVNL
ncbi:MAG: YARHG domain-containing protein, partial [Bacteroidaceae bacterium]|nr:YARHG domain-containing protein [Bacteroidaceae bacterium]